MSEYDFAAAYQRILDVTGAASQTALAKALGVKQSTVFDAKRRENIPSGWLVTLVERYGVSPKWIKTGDGPQRITRSLKAVPTQVIFAELGRRWDSFWQALSIQLKAGKPAPGKGIGQEMTALADTPRLAEATGAAKGCAAPNKTEGATA